MKKLFFSIFFIGSCVLFCNAQHYIINTIAGDTLGFSGDGGPATAAEMNQPWSVAIDKIGNIYIADYDNNRIRQVNTNGIITTIAGTGVNGYSGDGGQATAAKINFPTGVAIDAANNVYIADLFNNRVRMVNAAGIISTFAGNGVNGFAGDGGQATAAEFKNPAALTIDASGNVYICDFYSFRIRKVNASGIISSIAGNGSFGYSGDGGPATAAKLWDVVGVTVDASSNVYIADEGNGRVRVVNTSGIISTFAGNGTQGFSGDGGQATAAELNHPYGVLTDGQGDLFVADYSNSVIRVISPTGIINTIAGTTGGFSGDGGPATAAQIFIPTSMAEDAANKIYICDNGNNRIRELVPQPAGINWLSQNQTVSIYPNPSNGVFQTQIRNYQLGIRNEIEVYNFLGKNVYSSSIHNSSFSIDISNQPTGVYLYRIFSETTGLISEGKLVIVK